MALTRSPRPSRPVLVAGEPGIVDHRAMGADPQYNPYAAPQERVVGRTREAGASSSFESERRSVLLCIALMIATLGLYGPIWLFRRRRFLNSLDSPRKLEVAYPALVIAFTLVGWVLELDVLGMRDLARLFTVLSGLVNLAANFRVAHILRSEFARSGRLLRVSSLPTFFLGILYLQHVINKGADTPPRRSRSR